MCRYTTSNLDYGTDDPVFDPSRNKRFFSSPNIQTDSRLNPASYSMGTGGSFSGNKAAGS
jgi:hypothetical protein